MPIRQVLKGTNVDYITAEGYLYHDYEAVSSCQRECTKRFGATIQEEHEIYMSAHPEVLALLKIFISKISKLPILKRANGLKAAAEYFTRPTEKLDKEIREFLKLPPEGGYLDPNKKMYNPEDLTLMADLIKILGKYYPESEWRLKSDLLSPPNTVSSSFISLISSATTLPTPEPIPTPEPTMPEVLFAQISNTVDKVIYTRFTDAQILYDISYCEVKKTVEAAMEIPVIELREDIAEMLFNMYESFEAIIKNKELIAAEIAWGKRMRKKLKRTLRRQDNFKGYVTPPTPKSIVSSHESYLIPPQRPCICHPQWKYNRYTKDRFGIYLPDDEVPYDKGNITTTPVLSDDEDKKEDEAKPSGSVPSTDDTETEGEETEATTEQTTEAGESEVL